MGEAKQIAPIEERYENDKIAWQTEIQEIVRVAQQNPAALIDYLKCNFPIEWGLTKQQHRMLVRPKRRKK